MAQLFLDANILLDFFRFGDDDISEIGKLVALVKDGDISLHVNSHLADEIDRNRENVVSGSFSELKSKNYGLRTPNYCASLPEFENLKEILKAANKAHNKLISAVEGKIRGKNLPADKLISAIFEFANEIDVNDEILDKARKRVDLNNPPGKSNSLGDALHWECLLTIAHGYGMDIVSRDGDFSSELDPKELKGFLKSEWKNVHGQHAEITLFRSLGDYFRERFPDIRLSDEAQKNDLIGQLQEAPNFSTTHSLISDLSQFSYFTNAQVRKLFEALVKNTQVGWIATDEDVHNFYMSLKDKAYLVPDAIQDEICMLLAVDKDEFFCPF